MNMNRTHDQITELARVVFDFYSDTASQEARLLAGDALELIEERDTVMLIARHDVEDAIKVLNIAQATLSANPGEEALAEIRASLASIEERLSDSFAQHYQLGRTR